MNNENIGSIPVIESEQTRKLVGIVTDRDLALKIVSEGRDAKSTNVEAVMTRKVVTCFAGDDLQKALDAMAEHQLRRILSWITTISLLGSLPRQTWRRVDQPEKTAETVKQIFAELTLRQ